MITVEQGVAFAHDRISAHDPLWALKPANVATDILVSNFVSKEAGGFRPSITVWGPDDDYSYRIHYPAGVVGHYEVNEDSHQLVNVTTPTMEAK